MQLFGYRITKQKRLYPEVIEVFENEIQSRMCFTPEVNHDQIIENFKQYYLFYKVVQLLESQGELIVSEGLFKEVDLDGEEITLKIRDFYNKKRIIDRLELLQECNLSSSLKASIVRSAATGLDNISFTKTY